MQLPRTELIDPWGALVSAKSYSVGETINFAARAPVSAKSVVTLTLRGDDVYGGVFRNLQHVDRNVWLVDKVLWAQEEVLIGAMLIVERRGYDWAVDMFQRTNDYLREKFVLKKHGSPLWMYASDRKVTYEAFLKMPKRVENFHHPRHLMLNLLSLERML